MDNNHFLKKSREIAARVGVGTRAFVKETHALAESAAVGVVSGLAMYTMGSVAQNLIDSTGAVKLTDSLAMTSLGVGAGIGIGTFTALVLTKAGLELKDRMSALSEAGAAKQLRGATKLTPEQIIKRDAMAVPTPKPADPAAAYNMAMDKASADGFITEREIRGLKSVEQASNTKIIGGMQALQVSGVLSQKSSDDLGPKAAYESEQAWAAWVTGEAAALSGKKQSIPERFAGNALYMSLYTRGVSDGVDQLKFSIQDLDREFNDAAILTIDGIPKDKYPLEEEKAKFEASIKVATGLLNEAQELTSRLSSEDHAKASQSNNQNALDSFFNSSGFAAASSNQNAQAGAQVRSQSAPKFG